MSTIISEYHSLIDSYCITTSSVFSLHNGVNFTNFIRCWPICSVILLKVGPLSWVWSLSHPENWSPVSLDPCNEARNSIPGTQINATAVNPNEVLQNEPFYFDNVTLVDSSSKYLLYHMTGRKTKYLSCTLLIVIKNHALLSWDYTWLCRPRYNGRFQSYFNDYTGNHQLIP